MKSMKIEKKLLFAEKIKEVNQMEAKTALVYQQEEDGSIRALGPLFIRGNMRLDTGDAKTFQEVLDMDVLAPVQKLSQDPFSLHVKDYYADVEEDGINVVIHLEINGLKDEKEVVEPITQEKTDRIEPFIPELKTIETNAEVAQEGNAMDVEDERISAVDEFEDLFEDTDTTFTSYRMVVAQPLDTYASIASRYDVQEEELRNANRNKEVSAKSLIVLPF